MLNKSISPVSGVEVERFLKRDDIVFCATLNKEQAHVGADFVIIATPKITMQPP